MSMAPLAVRQHAAGAKKDPATEALGRSQGGFSTKVLIVPKVTASY